MSSEAPAAMATNIVIATPPPLRHDRLSAGMTARYQSAMTGISAIGAVKRAARRIRAARRSRSRDSVLITTQAASAARAIATAAGGAGAFATAVRKMSDGQKLGLKKPAQTLPP